MPQHRELSVNGITMHVAEQGRGPLVLLLHGFPESWYSWRHQFGPLAEAGYRVVAPDQRGYGGTDRPEDVDAYTILHLVGDVVGLIAALGEREAVVVGHDWGAPVAWHTALMRPDLVRGVVGLSVPAVPRASRPPLRLLREQFGDDFYQLYFQRPGVADAELGRDPRATFRRVLGRAPDGGTAPDSPATGFLDRFAEPRVLPPWLTEADVDAFVDQYRRNGFTGGLNWYRNIDRNWELTAPWDGAVITPPGMFIDGDQDVVRGFMPADALPRLVPNLRSVHHLAGCGHWTQQERPREVNGALLEFLSGL
ncbi:alpha/beta hydrolase [Saccharothrix syringae]|uniref:Alpha/beta hydrolase n=1 Tax=Saccharothrix syringae TaxID=103733 RepID=A0A5Q0HEF2_SACSY|nr:alpha/beta hydrolase [Saccharothrix syringae]